MMTPEEYDQHLKKHLCWFCHKPTHGSHARQRQCPECRRKWSYHRREQQWILIWAFSLGQNASEASKKTRISYHTVLNHFRKFEAKIGRVNGSKADNFLDMVVKKKGIEKKIVPPRWSKFGVKLLFALIVKPTLPTLPLLKPPLSSDDSDYMAIS